MGAWGPGPFENDDAMGFVDRLLAASDLTPCSQTIGSVFANGKPSMIRCWLGLAEYLEADEASEAVAAAEVLAAALGHPVSQLPGEIREWLQRHQVQLSIADVRLARTVVRWVRRHSELNSLWSGRDGIIWREFLRDLEKRLRA